MASRSGCRVYRLDFSHWHHPIHLQQHFCHVFSLGRHLPSFQLPKPSFDVFSWPFFLSCFLNLVTLYQCLIVLNQIHDAEVPSLNSTIKATYFPFKCLHLRILLAHYRYRIILIWQLYASCMLSDSCIYTATSMIVFNFILCWLCYYCLLYMLLLIFLVDSIGHNLYRVFL